MFILFAVLPPVLLDIPEYLSGSGKKIDVILENEMRLPNYDIEEKGRKIT